MTGWAPPSFWGVRGALPPLTHVDPTLLPPNSIGAHGGMEAESPLCSPAPRHPHTFPSAYNLQIVSTPFHTIHHPTPCNMHTTQLQLPNSVVQQQPNNVALNSVTQYGWKAGDWELVVGFIPRTSIYYTQTYIRTDTHTCMHACMRVLIYIHVEQRSSRGFSWGVFSSQRQ